MSWSGTTFSLLYNWPSRRDAGLPTSRIGADEMQAQEQDLADGLEGCIRHSGEIAASADLPMGTFKHTGVGPATARTNYLRVSEFQDGGHVWIAGGGTADAITATYAPSLGTLTNGQCVRVRAASANATTTPTFAPNGLTAKTIVKGANSALVAGDIAGQHHELQLQYNSTTDKWHLLNPATPQFALVTSIQNSSYTWVDGGGTANAITATYAPAVAALTNGMLLEVRATAANTTTTPTFAPNGLTAKTIVKSSGGTALVVGDIRGDGHELLLRYAQDIDKWVLLNPGYWHRGIVFKTARSSAPGSFGTHTSITTAFDGDLSGVYFPTSHTLTGAATAGQPASGYTYTPEVMPHYTYLDNEAGHNEATASNDGRTGIAAYRVKFDHSGQGDCIAYNATGFVDSTRAGSTLFYANPAAVLFNGNLTAGAAGVYLNAGEMLLDDDGFDCGGIGWVVNLDRSVATAAKSAWWAGIRVASIGAEEIDVAFSARGPANFGLDLSFLTLSADLAAISLKLNQRIYLNVTAADASGLLRFPSAVNTDWIDYTTTGITGIRVVVGGAAIGQFTSGGITTTQEIFIPTGKKYHVNSLPVLTDRVTGFVTSAGTGAKDASAFNVDTFTATDANIRLLGKWVKAIHDAGITHGFIGA